MSEKVISRISGKEIAKAQYITELVCSRRYKKEMKKDAQTGFWAESVYWTKEYKKQIQKAHSLLRMYDFHVIIKVLESESWMYSLFNKSLASELLAEQTKHDKITTKMKDKTIEVVDSNNFRTKQFGGKGNKLNKLRDME